MGPKVPSDKNQITQKFFDFSKEKIIDIIRHCNNAAPVKTKDAEEMYVKILNSFHSSTTFDIEKFLRTTSYVTKCTINLSKFHRQIF